MVLWRRQWGRYFSSMPAVRQSRGHLVSRQCVRRLCSRRASRRYSQPREVPVNSVPVRAALLSVAGLVCALACGCAGTKDTASKDKLTQNVGRYSPPPSISDEDKPKVGVPSFVIQQVPGQFSGNKSQLAQVA